MPNPFPKRKRIKPSRKKLVAEVEQLYAEVVEGETVLSLRLPNWRNAEDMIENGLAAMTRIASQGDDWEIAYKAAGFLVQYGNQALERSGKRLEGSAMMAQLESLYRKALPVESESGELVVEEESGGK